MADPTSREAALITFLASAANISLLGVGGAFWGLVIGLAAYIALNGRLRRREPAKGVGELEASEGGRMMPTQRLPNNRSLAF